MSEEFKKYVADSGVTFDTLSPEEKRQCRESFDKSLLLRQVPVHRNPDSKLADALRDAILCGSVREEDEVLTAEGVTFPVENKASVIFIREFYDLFYKHFRDVIMEKDTEPGVILHGPPGVGKLLREGVTVVYEKVLANEVFVFPPTGECRVLTGTADAGIVPELNSPNTVHLFDACAGVNARDPYLNHAKLAIFTSPNETSYEQLLRSGVDFLVVPSYSRAELDKRRAYFPDVTDDAYQERIEMFGCGSIRLVLGISQAKAAEMLARAIENTTVRKMLDIIQRKGVDTVKGIISPHVLFTASLAEGADKSDLSSYRRPAVSLNIASSYIMGELIRKSKDEIMQFAERAATVFHNTPGLEATAGMFFENVAPLILAKGGTFRVRKFSDDGKCEEYDKQWPALHHVHCRHITTVSEVFRECTDGNSLYSFLGKMPGFDACRPPNEYFNFAVGDTHTINIEAAVKMCERVSKDDKVHLYFVVPADRFHAGWMASQSFTRASKQSNLKKLMDPDAATRNKNLDKLKVDSTQVNLIANTLVQYALRIPVGSVHSAGVGGEGAGQVRPFSTLTSASRSGGNRMAARVIQRMWKLIV
eukprot:gene26347-31827_t